MREVGRVKFETTGIEADRRLVKEYLLDAVTRLPETSACDRMGYAPQGQLPTDGGEVLLFFDGDPDTIVESERKIWNSLIERELIVDWQFTKATERFIDIFGRQGGDLYLRVHYVASLMSMVIFKEFETPPAPVDAFPDEKTHAPVGWWAILHLLTVHQGYSLDNEFEAYIQGVEHTLNNIAEHKGANQATAQIDNLIETLETQRDVIANQD